MGIIATAVKHMLAAGMHLEAIIIAIEEMEADSPAPNSEPVDLRSKSAIRQKRYRENKKLKASQGVTKRNDVTENVTNVTHRATNVTKNVTNNAFVTPGVTVTPSPAPSPLLPPDPQQPPAPTHTPVCDTGARASGDLFGGDDKPAKPKKSGKKKDEPFVLPEHIPEDEWDHYVAMRDRIRKPMTPHAKRLAVAELDRLADAGWPPGDVLNHSTMNSYQGLFPPKDRSTDHGSRNLSAERKRQGTGFRDPVLADLAAGVGS